ncbi:hypothetical protein [uncultured Bradyrhizobium sp.]|uniref:hypothetical protein n=1 Tax=uncultured Bradyrhizobium sp. TaxID=199684 RepID=UPI0026393807|nr:hypothetical protein [uncultured Bradyrhizobium sp.]
MPSPRCSFNENGALALVPTTWNPDGAPGDGFEGAGGGEVTGGDVEAGGLGDVPVFFAVLPVVVCFVLDAPVLVFFALPAFLPVLDLVALDLVALDFAFLG